eukprot:352171-Chlamydomonas_euryale.AAC.6
MLKTGLGQSRVERQMVKKMLQLALPGDPLVERLGHGIDAQGQVSTEAQQQEVALRGRGAGGGGGGEGAFDVRKHGGCRGGCGALEIFCSVGTIFSPLQLCSNQNLPCC